MKKLLLMFLLFFFSATVFAEGKEVLRVLMKDVTSVYFLLEEKPLITFQGDDVKIASDTEEAVVERMSVERFDFVDEIPTGIEDVTEDEESPIRDQFKLTGEAIYITGLAPGCKVQLLTIDGKVFISDVADDNGCVTIYLNTLSTGIYLVNYNETTIKFIKS